MDGISTFNDLLSQILGLNDRQIQSVIEEGIDSIQETTDWTYKDIKKFVEKKENARIANARVHFGKKAKNLHALAFWAKDMQLRGRNASIQGFTHHVLGEYRKLYELDHELSESPPETVAMPQKLDNRLLQVGQGPHQRPSKQEKRRRRTIILRHAPW